MSGTGKLLVVAGIAVAVVVASLLLAHAMRDPQRTASSGVGTDKNQAAPARVTPVAGDVAPEVAPQPESHDLVAMKPHRATLNAAGGDSEPVGTEGQSAQITITISPKQRQAMVAARWSRMRTQVKYRLPTTYILQQLERAVDPAVRLTDEQREQITHVDAVMRPKIDEALAGLWSERERVRTDLQKAVAEKDQATVGTLRAEYTRLYAEESRIRRDQLNEQYKTLLGDVLNDEQMEMLSGDLKSGATMRKLYGPRQVTSQSIQYQNTNE